MWLLLIPYVFMTLRAQMRDAGIQLEYLDGRKIPGSDMVRISAINPSCNACPSNSLGAQC